MLERDKGHTTPVGFILCVELQPHVSLEDVKFHLADALNWLEGCGQCDVECLGEITTYDAPTEPQIQGDTKKDA